MQKQQITFCLAQIEPFVGDIDGNRQLLTKCCREAADAGAAAIIFPELAVTGYPPEDLLLRPEFIQAAAHSVKLLCSHLQELPLTVVLGCPIMSSAGLVNALAVIERGRVVFEYAKQVLPNYQVFDEKRYFVSGTGLKICEIAGLKVGLSICEDIWHGELCQRYKQAGAQLLINASASPYHRGKQQQRLQLLRTRCSETTLPMLYVNMVGGQDELVYDGGSMALNAAAEVMQMAPNFVEGLHYVDLSTGDGQLQITGKYCKPLMESRAEVYAALVTGIRSYVRNNGFSGVVMGLSGGIDSALTLTLAVDALGADRVTAVMMKSRYTSQLSCDLAQQQSALLGTDYRIMDIDGIYSECVDQLQQTMPDEFAADCIDTTEENLQARCRGILLMALSNKRGWLVLTTGNKSENATGYATLYGDMAGGFNPLKDVTKTLVYELADYRNGRSAAIPRAVLERPPSAELRPDQLDADSLPPYAVLDQILKLFVEEDCSPEQIISSGIADRDTVLRVCTQIMANEYKRRQAPTGIRISNRAFGRDRRYPISSGWRGRLS